MMRAAVFRDQSHPHLCIELKGLKFLRIDRVTDDASNQSLSSLSLPSFRRRERDYGAAALTSDFEVVRGQVLQLLGTGLQILFE